VAYRTTISLAGISLVNGRVGADVSTSMLRLLLVGVLGVWVLQADSSADALIHRVESRYNGTRTLSVEFTESYSMQGHRRPPEQGTLILRKQGKMRWDYSRPAGKLFVSDGKNVYLYSARDNKVEKVPLKDTEDMRAPLAFLLGRLDMKKEFRDFTVEAGEGGTWLAGSSKNERVPYEKVEMLIAADGSVRQLKVAGRDQSQLAFEFTGERLNPPVDDSIFRFQIPAGAEMVDTMEFAGTEK
jgi:outer membrane lipoprotein carrier protein